MRGPRSLELSGEISFSFVRSGKIWFSFERFGKIWFSLKRRVSRLFASLRRKFCINRKWTSLETGKMGNLAERTLINCIVNDWENKWNRLLNKWERFMIQRDCVACYWPLLQLKHPVPWIIDIDVPFRENWTNTFSSHCIVVSNICHTFLLLIRYPLFFSYELMLNIFNYLWKLNEFFGTLLFHLFIRLIRYPFLSRFELMFNMFTLRLCLIPLEFRESAVQIAL